MLLKPRAPGGELRRKVLHFSAGERAVDRRGQELAPQGVGLMVIHDYCVHDQLSENAKREDLALDLAGKKHARKAEWSPRDRDGYASHGIVHHFVGAELGGGVGPVITFDGEPNDAI